MNNKGDTKKELKRYTLCEYIEPQVRYFNNYEDYKKLVKMLDDLNKKGKNQFYFGNISCEFNNGLYMVTVHVYNRLTPKMTISEIDAITSNKSEEEIIKKYKPLLRTIKPYTPDINIMYFEEKNSKERKEKDVVKRVKYIPVLYKRDSRYMDGEYIKDCIAHMANIHDLNFFTEFANEFCFHHIVSDEIENIRISLANCSSGLNDYSNLKRNAIRLYDNLIKERNNKGELARDENGECIISKRRQRDLGFFVRDYMVPLNKRNSPMRYNKELTQRQLEIIKEREEKQAQKETEKRKDFPKAEQLKLF